VFQTPFGRTLVNFLKKPSDKIRDFSKKKQRTPDGGKKMESI
jgi:hypothetical protein